MFYKRKKSSNQLCCPPLTPAHLHHGEKNKTQPKRQSKRERENILMSLIYQNLLFFFFSSWYFIPRGLQIVFLIFLPDKGNVSSGICSLQHSAIVSVSPVIFDAYQPTSKYLSLLSTVLGYAILIFFFTALVTKFDTPKNYRVLFTGFERNNCGSTIVHYTQRTSCLKLRVTDARSAEHQLQFIQTVNGTWAFPNSPLK